MDNSNWMYFRTVWLCKIFHFWWPVRCMARHRNSTLKMKSQQWNRIQRKVFLILAPRKRGHLAVRPRPGNLDGWSLFTQRLLKVSSWLPSHGISKKIWGENTSSYKELHTWIRLVDSMEWSNIFPETIVALPLMHYIFSGNFSVIILFYILPGLVCCLWPVIIAE